MVAVVQYGLLLLGKGFLGRGGAGHSPTPSNASVLKYIAVMGGSEPYIRHRFTMVAKEKASIIYISAHGPYLMKRNRNALYVCGANAPSILYSILETYL